MDNNKIYIKPVTHKASYTLGAKIILISTILFLLGVGIFIFIKNRKLTYPTNSNIQKKVKIQNKTDRTQIITLPSGEKIQLKPNQITESILDKFSQIKSHSYNIDGTKNNLVHKIFNDNIKNLYVTNFGFRTNDTSNEKVTMENNSPYPILFIEKSSKGGRRWLSNIIPPYTKTENNFFPHKSILQVSHPSEEDQPISQLYIKNKVSKITFNGNILRSY